MAAAGGKSYPSTAYILTLIGGIFVLIGGLYTAVITAVIGSAFLAFFPGIAALLIGLGVVALLFGILIIVGAMKMRNDPASAHTWGIIVIILAILSWIGGGGFFIGFLLALIGGILALVWHPPATAQAAWGQPQAPGAPMGMPAAGAPAAAGQKVCASCGSANAPGTQFCAKCGAALPP